MASETSIVFESLCYGIFEQRKPQDGPVTVSGRCSMGDISILISYDGAMFDPSAMNSDSLTPEKEILSAYGDKISFGYRAAHNRISISVRRSNVKMSVLYVLSILLSVIAYQLLSFFVSESGRAALQTNVTAPLVSLFFNAVLMIGAPLTFLSLIKNLTDTYILSERYSGTRKLWKSIALTSFVAVVCAIALSYLLIFVFKQAGAEFVAVAEVDMGTSVAGIISSLMPSDIFTPFQTVSPFPLIIIAMLITYAFCSVGRYFERLKEAVDVCYVLFSRLLSIVMYVLPLFTLIAMLDFLLIEDFYVVLSLVDLAFLLIICLNLFCVYFAVRLKLNGIHVRDFIKKIRPLLRENMKISSAIDAAPYNIRYIAKTFGIDRRKLKETVPILAQINLSGNCFMLTMISMIIIIFGGRLISPFDAFTIGFLVFFLSFGAPNQPGSCLIGIMIVLQSVHATQLVPLAIYSEAILGWLINLVNVADDVVIVVTEDAKSRRRKQSTTV